MSAAASSAVLVATPSVWKQDGAAAAAAASPSAVDWLKPLSVRLPGSATRPTRSSRPQASGDGEASAEGPTEGNPLPSTGAREAGLESVGLVEPVGSVGTAGEQAADTITRTTTPRAWMTGERTAES